MNSFRYLIGAQNVPIVNLNRCDYYDSFLIQYYLENTLYPCFVLLMLFLLRLQHCMASIFGYKLQIQNIFHEH